MGSASNLCSPTCKVAIQAYISAMTVQSTTLYTQAGLSQVRPPPHPPLTPPTPTPTLVCHTLPPPSPGPWLRPLASALGFGHRGRLPCIHMAPPRRRRSWRSQA